MTMNDAVECIENGKVSHIMTRNYDFIRMDIVDEIITGIEENPDREPRKIMMEVFRKHKWRELGMEFEIFTGPNGLKYYVYDSGNWNDVERAVCRRTKAKRGTYKCVTVWIVRGAEETETHIIDHLHLTEVQGAERKLAAVRK